MHTDHPEFIQALQKQLNKANNQIVFDETEKRFAWSTDASYFRIVPQVVVIADDLASVKTTLQIANQYQIPVTFRAAGSSLSGQAIGSGILLKLGYDGFRNIEISQDHSKITLGAAVIGGEANAALKPFNRKIGPDPATINTAMIAGIAANNASGMCCGTHENSYQTLADLHIMLADGTELNTACPKSRTAFQKSHSDLLRTLSQLAETTRNNQELASLITKKYRIKNTMGYSLNALIDFKDPFEILKHLIIGSEGTLAFIKEVTYHTVSDAQYKSSALAIFHNIQDAAMAVDALHRPTVSAAEFLDWSSIKPLIGLDGMPAWLSELSIGSALLLIETQADTQQSLDANIQKISKILTPFKMQQPLEFTQDPTIYKKYWSLRSALFPLTGGNRPKGSTIITEDVAFHRGDLAKATADLSALFQRYHYHEGIIFGHALDGNFHFIITPTFASHADIDHFKQFMQAVAEVVTLKYQGSIKAEHGTGRAAAPFVEIEWGKAAYALMHQIKQLFDPQNLLNPGVLLNDNPNVFVENMKTTPIVANEIDQCIDCGFCEKTCPTSALNMSPRHRITLLREIQNLKNTGKNEEAQQLAQRSKYDIIDSCTVCQLCLKACPLDNNVGTLVQRLRHDTLSKKAKKYLNFQAKHYKLNEQMMRFSLSSAAATHTLLGEQRTAKISDLFAQYFPFPKWHKHYPHAAKNTLLIKKLTEQKKQSSQLDNKAEQIKRLSKQLRYRLQPPITEPILVGPTGFIHKTILQQRPKLKPKVIYFAACGGRTFGNTPLEKQSASLSTIMITLLERAGFDIIIPHNIFSLCCGQPFESKGDYKNADYKLNEAKATLSTLSQNGEIPILVDAASCSKRFLSQINKQKTETIDLAWIDASEFLIMQIIPKLRLNKKPAITLHIGCSARHLQQETTLIQIANQCADFVFLPEDISCCGFAGDLGFYQPEINASALRTLKARIPKNITEGYYSNRMCELGLTHHSGIAYRHIAYLVEECSR